jgi:hypothetical protein
LAESAFIAAVEVFLGKAMLAPAPASLGVAEPVAAEDLPALVLSLESTQRLGAGLGARTATMEGALAWQASIDLAKPVLPAEPSFSLVNDARTVLTLPHGGLVRSDGTEGALAAADLGVTVAGAPQTVVTNASPGAGQVVANAQVGQLSFGTPLPTSGIAQASYFVGRWEQRVERISGTLRIDVLAGSLGDVRSLSDAVLAALVAPGALSSVHRLLSLTASSLGPVGAPETAAATARRRSLRFAFAFEHEVNQPDSSGGIIRQIPITAQFMSV